MRKIGCLLFLMLVCFSGYNLKVSAEGGILANIVFSSLEVKKSEEFTMQIVLEDYESLYQSDVYILVDMKILEVVTKFSIPLVDSIYSEIEVINNSQDGNLLHLCLRSKSLSGYNYSNLNHLCSITFKAKEDISDVSKLFLSETYTNGYGMKMAFLNSLIIYQNVVRKCLESLKIGWKIEKYEVEVNTSADSLKETIIQDLNVLNRDIGEYLLEIITDEVYLDKLGTYVVKVKFYDKITKLSTFHAKAIDVIDTTSPVITIKNDKLLLEDSFINDLSINMNFLEDFDVSGISVTDNYDQLIKLKFKYFDDSLNEIVNYQSFLSYLKKKQKANISVSAADESGNCSIEHMIELSILDTTFPAVTILNNLEIIDTDLEEFNLDKLIKVTDQYDDNPMLVISYYNKEKEPITDVIQELKNNHLLYVEYYTKDKSSNKSPIYNLIVSLKDTLPPQINGQHNYTTYDYLENEFDRLLNESIVVVDNLDPKPTLRFAYYLNDSVVELGEFKNKIFKGEKGKVIVKAMDDSGNESDEFIIEIEVKDTVSPVINILHLENGKKYFEQEKIVYEVSDNFLGNLDVIVLLNGKTYNGDKVFELGDYELTITATDQSLNQSTKTINFTIIKDNLIGCSDDAECYVRNYTEIIVAVVILFACTIIIVVFRIGTKAYKAKKKTKDINDEITIL